MRNVLELGTGSRQSRAAAEAVADVARDRQTFTLKRIDKR
jgi:hypothetical protein